MRKIQASRPTKPKAMYTIAGWSKTVPNTGIRCSSGIATVGVAPSRGYVDPNSACWSTLVIPSPARVIAIPTTIWSSPSLTQSTTIASDPIMPPAIPVRKPTQIEPL